MIGMRRKVFALSEVLGNAANLDGIVDPITNSVADERRGSLLACDPDRVDASTGTFVDCCSMAK